MANEITDEQIGIAVTKFFKGVVDFIKAFCYGIGEIFKIENKEDKKSYRGLIGFFILLIFSVSIYLKADLVIKYLPKPSESFAGILEKPLTFKILSVMIVVLYVKLKGDEKLKFLNSFTEKFQAVGLHSKLLKEKVTDGGKKIKIKDYPKLLKRFEGDKSTTYIFTSNGIPLNQWKKKISELESAFGFGILKIENKKGSSKVIRMITVPYEEKEKRRKFDKKFEKLGLYTKLDGFKEYPELLDTEKEEKKILYKFKSDGIPLKEWKENKAKLETQFDTNVLSLKYAKNSKQIIEMVTVPTKYNIKTEYRWEDKFIPNKDFEVVLGEGLLKKATLNFNKTPHMLIGGLTGSGKSVLVRSIIWQVIKKGAKVYLVDFKGGIELESFEDFGEVVFERKRAVQILDGLVKEHHARIDIFKSKGVKNIIQYNEKVSKEERIKRVFVVVDEVAELLDNTGATKQEKELFEEIESKMNTLARLSRASGINMILATQRPDAKVIKGQIKNNLGARISGRMTDKEPSIMILGSPEAKDLPKIEGRFLYSIGAEPIEFQGYYFKDEDIKKGNYEKGKMIVAEDEKVEIKDNVEILEDDEVNYEDKEEIEEEYEESVIEDELPGYWEEVDDDLEEDEEKKNEGTWVVEEEI
ncbi:MAG: DNA translocase FtsK [Firmicutes bacterium]|nr:DNA translocase FtsK [Bacillota bacterium]